MDLKAPPVRSRMVAPVPVITPQTSVATALRLLREHALPALPVCDGDRFVGLVGERDLLRLTPSEATTLDVYELRDVLERLTVARITAPGPTVTPQTPLPEAAMVMLDASTDALAVVDGDRLVGLLPWTCLLAAAIE